MNISAHPRTFIHSFIHSFIPSFFHSSGSLAGLTDLVHDKDVAAKAVAFVVNSSRWSVVHSFIYSFIHSFVHSFLPSFFHSSGSLAGLTDLVHDKDVAAKAVAFVVNSSRWSVVHSFIYSFIHSFVHSFLPSFFHSSGSLAGLTDLVHDKDVAAKAVAFVVNSSRRGIVTLCADVAAILRSKLK